LLPALAVVLSFVAIAGLLLSPLGARHMGAMTGILASFFSANFYLLQLPTGYFDVSTDFNPLLHTWTLGVEEQFYVVFPVVLLAAWRIGALLRSRLVSRVLAFAAIGGLSYSSFFVSTRWAAGFAFGGIASPQSFAFYSSPARAWEFGLGAMLALAAPSLRRLPVLGGSILATVGLAAIGFGAFAVGGGSAFVPGVALVPVGGACAILAAGSASRNGVSQLLGSRASTWMGDLSYSWYLWHWPLIVFARALTRDAVWAAPVASVLSLLPAWASYRYVENPIRSSARLRGSRAVALAAVCIGLPVLASAGLLKAQRLMHVEHVLDLHADVVRGCDNDTPLGQRRGGHCTWTVSNPKGQVVLIGDSNAGQFTEPVARAATQAGFTATVATFSSCPFVQLSVTGSNAGEGLCRRFDQESLAALLRMRPNLVIIAARTDSYIEGGTVGLALPGDSAATTVPEAKAALWTRGVRTEAAQLNRAGIPVAVVHPLPAMPVEPAACAVVLALTGACSGAVPRDVARKRLRRSVLSERLAVTRLASAHAVSLVNAICGRERCASQRSGEMMYRDGKHLSVRGSLQLTPWFSSLIEGFARR
jgi:peptidoglycan/LPS O-acetylase OafA/YrhL